MTSGALDIVIRAQTDEAQAKVDKLASSIQQNLAQQGLGALESMSERVEQAFAQLEVEGSRRAASLQKAFSSLGVSSASSVKTQIQSIISAFRELKENSGELSPADLSTAYSRMVGKLKDVAAAYRAQGAAAKSGSQEASAAARSIEAAFGKLGVTSGEQVKAKIQEIVQAYRTLRTSGTASIQDLDHAYAAMVTKIQGVASAYKDQGTAARSGMSEAEQASQAVEKALSSLGIRSAPQVKARIQEIIKDYRLLRESGTLSAKDLDAAHGAMVSKLQGLGSAYRNQGSAAKSGMGEAEKATQAVDKALSTLGVQSGQQVKARIQEIIQAYRALRDSGTLSAQDLQKAHTAMVSKLQTVSAAYRSAGKGQQEHNQAVERGQVVLQGMGNSLSGLVKTYLSLYAAQRIFTSIITTYREADKAAYNLESSVAAANREFSRTGSLEEWKNKIAAMRNELKVYSGMELTAATSRTIDMTKRLGLSSDQMEVLIKRTADLSAGKTELTDGIERVTSALRGEAEASEYLGLTLNEDYVKGWHAANNATGKAWASLTDMEKAQVRYQVFLEQTTASQGKASESINSFSGAVNAAAAAWSDAVTNNENIIATLKDVATYIKNNREEIGEFATMIVNATAAVIRFVVENKELVLALVGVLGAAKVFSVLSDGIIAVAAAGTALKGLGLVSRLASWSEAASVAAASLGGMAKTATMARTALASIGLGPLGMLATAAYFATTQVTKLGVAMYDAAKAQQVASKMSKLNEEMVKKVDAAYVKMAASLGYTVTGQKDWNEKVNNGTINLKTLSKAVSSAAQSYGELQARLSRIGADGKAAMGQLADEQDFAAKSAKQLAETESGGVVAAIAAHRDKAMSLITLADKTAQAQIREIERAAISEKEKQDALKIVYRQNRDDKIGFLKDWLDALKSDLDAALAEEKRWADEVRNAQKTTADNLRDLARQGMSDQQRYDDVVAEGREKLAKANELKAKGDAESIAKAVELYKEVENIAKASVSASNGVVELGKALYTAQSLTSEAGKNWELVAKQAESSAKTAADNTLEQIQNIKKAIDDLQKTPISIGITVNTIPVEQALAALNGTETKSKHIIKDNSDDALADIDKLQGHDTWSTHKIYIQEVQQKATGGPVRQVPAMVMPGEVVIPPEYASRMSGLLHAVNSMRLPVPKLADGGVFRPFRSGLVPGVGDQDSEPVLLPEGAFVIRKAAVRMYGADWLQSLAADGSVPHFATGGRVSLGNLAALQGGIRLPDWLEQLRLARPAAPAPAEAAAPEAPVAPTSPAPLAIAVAKPAAFRAMTTPLAGKRDMTARGTSALGRLNGLRHAASLKFATGGDLDETLADIALERQRTQEDYDEAVAEAQTNHDDDLADLLTQEQEDLDSIAEELASTLKELQETLQAAQKQYQEDLADAQDQYNDATAAYKEFLYNPTITYSSKNNVGNSVLMSTEDVDKDNGTYYTPATYSQYASGGFVTRYKKQYLSSFSYGIPTRWRWAPYKDYSSSSISEDRSLRAAIEDAKAQIAEVKATWATAQSDYSTGVTDAKQTAVEDTASTKSQADSDTDDLNTDLEKTLADLQKDFDRAMEDLDIQEARARADAEDEGTYSISGFTSWLRDGGPVKALLKHFALGGPVKAGLARLFPGLPRFEDGGVAPLLPGAVPGQDSILAALTPGEGIINLPAMRRLISERALQALNAMDLPGFLDALPHYADGGVAGLTASAKTAAAMGPSSMSSGESYSATLNLQIGGKSYETRAARSTARELAKELRRQGVNVR